MTKDPSQIRVSPLKGNLALDLLFALLAFALPAITILSLTYPPPIISQGQAHRIFYIHVPIAWIALYAPMISCVCAILFLIKRDERFDFWSVAANRVALLFGLAVIISGPLWASTEWGTYWDWSDYRLMSFFVLVLSLFGYFYARSVTDHPDRRAVLGAVMSIIAAISAAITWFAIRLVIPEKHPQPVLSTMAPAIRDTFWLAVIAYHLIFLLFMRVAIRREYLRSLTERVLFRG